MKNLLLNLLVLSTIAFMGCKGSQSSEAEKQTGKQQQQPGGGNGGQPAPTEPKSPYDFAVTYVKNNDRRAFTYAEAIEVSDANKIALQLYTHAPRGMCNLSTLTDSSWYQPKFDYLLVVVDKSTLGEKTAVGTFGRRGDDFGAEDQVSGTLNLTSTENEKFEGWLSLKNRSVQIEGNFSVVNCTRTHTLVKNLKLDYINEKAVLKDKASGAKVEVWVSFSYRIEPASYYQGYVSRMGVFNIAVEAAADQREKFSFSTASMSSGDYISLGNHYGNSNSPGPGIGFFEGNTLTLNDRSIPHMTDDPEFQKMPLVKIEFLAATNKHLLTVRWNGREYSGEF